MFSKMKIILPALSFVILGTFFTIDTTRCGVDDYAIRSSVLPAIAGDYSDHNCRLWSGISAAFPESLLFHNLVTNSNSLKFLSGWANVDGWGIVSYSQGESTPQISRGALRAFEDPLFDSAVLAIDTALVSIVLAHIRKCTDGCCCHYCYSIPDPHPFWRFKDGRYWTFAHNGSLEKAVLYDLIGSSYLSANPPNGSGIPECAPADTALITDSELLFLFLLKKVEENSFNTFSALQEAMVELIYSQPAGKMNFILSDSREIWAFRKGNTLSCRHDSLGGYTLVASEPTNPLEIGWQTIPEYTLVHATAWERPEFADLRAFLPPIVECPPETSLYFAPPREACISGFGFSDPDNNVLSATVNPGWLIGDRVCFNPVEGANTIVYSVSDSAGGVSVCSTLAIATATEAGEVNGIVVDTALNPLADVEMTIEDLFIVAESDSVGYFSIPYIVPGNYDIKFRRQPFMDTVLFSLPVIANQAVTLAITLRPGCFYVAGDMNGDNGFNGLDVTYGVNYLKGIGQAPPDICDCFLWGPFYAAADANGNCVFNGLDITYAVNYLKGMGKPPASCPECLPWGP